MSPISKRKLATGDASPIVKADPLLDSLKRSPQSALDVCTVSQDDTVEGLRLLDDGVLTGTSAALMVSG